MLVIRTSSFKGATATPIVPRQTHSWDTWLIISAMQTMFTSSGEIKTWKTKSGPSGIQTHDLCDTGAVLYQLGYLTIWELATLWVRNVPVDSEELKIIYGTADGLIAHLIEHIFTCTCTLSDVYSAHYLVKTKISLKLARAEGRMSWRKGKVWQRKTGRWRDQDEVQHWGGE